MNPPVLEELLVISLEQAVAAPYCSRLLAEAGARVIKLERPEGDFAREYDSMVAGESTYFVWLNGGKESVSVDLREEHDRQLLRNMLLKANIFLQNLKPGAVDRLGFGYPEVRKLNQGLVMCSISGYGSEGEYSNMKAYDALIQAESGLCSVTGQPGQPSKVGASICDISTGLTAFSEILKALMVLRRDGEGSHVECSLFGVLSEWMAVPLLCHEYGKKQLRGTGIDHPQIVPYGSYETADGPIFIVVQNRREWKKLCEEGLKRPEMTDDPRFSTNENRISNREELKEHFEEVFRNLPRNEVARKLNAAGIACGNINSVEDLAGHPALQRKQLKAAGHQISTVRRVGDTFSKPAEIPALDQNGPSLREEFGSS